MFDDTIHCFAMIFLATYRKGPAKDCKLIHKALEGDKMDFECQAAMLEISTVSFHDTMYSVYRFYPIALHYCNQLQL